ncbi:MAG TPA: glycosyltransferase family 9 protein [Steroidobacteraceae bacterium]|nr:glycosyltransferase family 9 protein [Steroidobacteraceae bacterium]
MRWLQQAPILAPAERPRTICLLRLSALGDTCHAVPLVRAIERAWPDCRITWIIGRSESKLMSLLPEIEFLTVDKQRFVPEFARLRAALRGRRFDLLLHLQVSFRASLLSTLVRAPIRLGFDRPRARELQWLFTNRRIAPRRRQHVLDGFLGFADALGIADHPAVWNIPLPQDALAYARELIPDARPTLLISPCSSHPLRDWRAAHYAQVADHAARRWHMRVVLCGGASSMERKMGDAILAHTALKPCDQIGRDTLPQMLALLRAASVLLTPDSGPAHMATMVGTPVIGLYAATNPARSGPYASLAWCVDRFADAARTFMGREPGELPWAVKIEKPGVMDLIEPAEVIERLDRFMQQRARQRDESRLPR